MMTTIFWLWIGVLHWAPLEWFGQKTASLIVGLCLFAGFTSVCLRDLPEFHRYEYSSGGNEYHEPGCYKLRYVKEPKTARGQKEVWDKGLVPCEYCILHQPQKLALKGL